MKFESRTFFSWQAATKAFVTGDHDTVWGVIQQLLPALRQSVDALVQDQDS
jgi:uncharacterized protein with HEPN domain